MNIIYSFINDQDTFTKTLVLDLSPQASQGNFPTPRIISFQTTIRFWMKKAALWRSFIALACAALIA